MIPPRRQVFLEVVNHEEYVQVEPNYGPDGKVVSGTPIEGTRTAFLHLRAPDGTVIRAEIPHEHLDRVLAMIFPDMLSPEEIASRTPPWSLGVGGRMTTGAESTSSDSTLGG